jgi:hypothetical protein
VKTSVGDPSPAWSILLIVPAALYAVVIAPWLGEYREGLWAELIAFDLTGTQAFGELAQTIRIWTLGALVVTTIAAVLLYSTVIRDWRRRLKAYNVQEVINYRGFVGWRVLMAFVAGCAVAAFGIFISESLRESEVASWILFTAAVGLFGSLQLLAIVFGLKTTLVLFRGR